ncbi:hypothetical protein E1B28_012351 [Marasmius oreades]|uniref:F-box domain-containing protein n=1 Tax=Marasmius oreades TaxID=181124 RepID=A0A9P7RRJ3_9AGAR|nr:uncharacterized protein E1B28_012351 [Marasmius oreades]KAG7088347.1 hypothetical protein E1B28_012351 [Marasmius oreades]
MEWKSDFKKAIESFKYSKYDEALISLNRALEHGGREHYVVFDSRSAVYSKIGELRLALLDAKKVISLAPTRWQGFSRAAHLFLQFNRFVEAQKMADAALKRLPADDLKNRASLLALIGEIKTARSRVTCHLATLPNELISEIFHYLVDFNPINVLLISKISGHLRNVALNTPSLWRTLVLTKKSPVRKSAWWIERSRGRIRELSLRRSLLEENRWTLENIKGILWDHLRILRLEDFDLTQVLEKHAQVGQLPSLEELELRDKLLDTSRDRFIIRFSHLRRLKLEGSITSLPDKFPSTLRYLSLQRIPERCLDRIFSLLASNPHLEALCLDTTFAEFWKTPTTVISLPYLTTLEICCLPQLFRFLTFPTLAVLRIKKNANIDMIIQSLVENGTGLLTEISVISCAVSNALFLQLLSMNPLLQSLVLNHLAYTANPVLEALAPPSQAGALCPALTHVDFSNCPDVQTGPLARLVKSRLAIEKETTPEGESSVRRPAPIDVIKVDGCPRIDAEFIPWFRQRVQTFSCIYMTKKAASWKR